MAIMVRVVTVCVSLCPALMSFVRLSCVLKFKLAIAFEISMYVLIFCLCRLLASAFRTCNICHSFSSSVSNHSKHAARLQSKKI